ncbi:MAG: peptidase S41 [Brevundimonas sp.]|uniref:S41 family peptidase n=1 Tax=Brevundimonas sp. TaxID=1871086 RepID=UPI0025833681|nr:PDZ domain-containing protein [Brevundimonas sp.]MCV0414748.1 peptidase S41 [Brevundimonas sp.]
MRPFSGLALSLALASGAALAQQPGPSLSAEDYRRDALSIDPLIAANYAYLDRFPNGRAPTTPRLQAEAEAVHDAATLLLYAERRLALLADPHAITGRSFSDSWAIVPSYADLWIEPEGEVYRITAVRDGSPAARAGVTAGETLVRIDGAPVARAVDAYWRDLGLEAGGDAGYAARVLAAGRRDRPRVLTFRDTAGAERTLTLDNLYAAGGGDRPPVEARRGPEGLTIAFNDSLGDDRTVAAFDAAMSQARPGEPVTLDLTDTPSGGDTVVARAVMGWFVTEARPYQVHRLMAEERQTGVPRQWIEEVLPRPARAHAGPVRVRVGRWTGSMGEGLAIGLDALGARVTGCPMAGLLGAIYDLPLERSGLTIKLPAERLSTVSGVPREAFRCAP